MKNSVSVIIPTLNNAETLPRVLDSVSRDPAVKEIIVVDGGSSDATTNIAREHGCIVLTEKGLKCPANARNQGSKSATCGILCFLEGDLDHFSPEFFSKVARTFNEENVVACKWKSRIVEDKLSEKLQRRFVDLNLFTKGAKEPRVVTAIRKDVFEAIGGYPLVGASDDVHFTERVQEYARTSGKRIAELGIISYYHRVHSFRSLIRQATWVGRTYHSVRRSALFGGLLASLIAVMFAPFTHFIFAIPYAIRAGSAALLAIWRKDAFYLLVPIIDALYSVFYFVGYFQHFYVRQLGRGK
jgi:glycosyltransferase involved in cell wall biosynthesis